MRTVPGTVSLSILNFSFGKVSKPPALLGALLLGLTLTLGGCSVGTGGLPSGLPGVGAGGGALTITTNKMPDGIAGRTYTRSVTIQGGVAPYTCSLSGALPPGLGFATVGNTCAITGTVNAGTLGPFNFTFQVTDSSAPFQVVSRSFAQNIRAEFSFTGLPAAFPDGVRSRTFGAAPQTAPVGGTNISATVGNGPLTLCGVNGVGANASLGAAVSGNTSCAVSSASGLAASGALALTLTATDTAITDPANSAVIIVPAKTISAPATVALTVQPILTSTPNFAPVPDAVSGRTFGAPARANLTFTATGGIAGQTISVTAGNPPTGIVCTPAAATLTCNSGGAAVTGTTQNFTTTATDPGNSATPSGNVMVPATINVLPTIMVSAFAIGNVTEQRAITTPVVVAATGGIQATLACSLAGSPAGLTATPGAGTCTIAGTPNAGTAGNYPAFTLNATDAGNATTPGQAPPGSATTALLDNPTLVLNGGAALVLPQSTVNQPYTPFDIPFTGGNGPAASFICTDVGGQLPANMTLATVGSNCEIAGTPTSLVNRTITIRVADTASTSTAAGNTSQAGNLTINNGVSFVTTSPLPAGTKGRAFNFTLTATGGTTFVAPPPYHFGPTGTLTGTGVGDCAGLTLSIGGVISGTPTAFTNTPCTIALTVTDKTGSMSTVSFTIPINDTLILAAFALGNGVQGRLFDQLLPFTGGNAPYGCAAPALPATLLISVNGLNCEIKGTPTAPFGPTLITVTVSDTATASTAAGNNAKSSNLTINAVLTITTAAVPDAVASRAYNFMLVATGGTGVAPAFTWGNPGGSGASLNTGTAACAGLNLNTASGLITGPASATSGACGFQVNVSDQTTASTAGITTANTNINFTVQPVLVVTTTQAQILNGLLNNPYTGLTFTATGGIGAQTWVAPGANTPPCPVPTGSIDGLALSAAGALSGTPAAASTAPNFFAFRVCVFDVGNAATPAGFANGNFTFDVMNNLAYIAAPGNSAVEIIDTTGNTQTTSAAPPIPIPVTGGNTPFGVAVSPNGRKAYATFATGGANAYMTIDTITNAVITPLVSMPSPTCQAPTDIAVTPDNTRLYIVCTAAGGGAVEEVAVFDATNDTLITEIPTGAGSSPKNLAIRADNARVYVTLNGLNELFTIDNTATPPVALGAPFVLDATTDQPFGIVLARNGPSTFAFISKQNPVLPNLVQKIDVVDVTNAPVNNNQISLTVAQVPQNLAAVPGDARIYFAIQGAVVTSNQFGVINNSVNPPVQVGTGFNLPDPAFPAAAVTPVDVAIPPLSPVPGTGERVYITQSTTNDVAIIDNKPAPPPAKNAASPIALTVGASPTRIKAIPVPK